jgi:hypothetical protein
LKKDNIRATFLIPRDEWQVYKAILGTFKAFNVNTGRTNPATPSDDLREYIYDFIGKHQDRLKTLIAEIEASAPNAPILKTLKIFVNQEEEQEKNEPKS